MFWSGKKRQSSKKKKTVKLKLKIVGLDHLVGTVPAASIPKLPSTLEKNEILSLMTIQCCSFRLRAFLLKQLIEVKKDH